MSKYSLEFKLEVIKAYIDGNVGGFETTSKFYNISNASILKKWVKRYENYGVDGLIKNDFKYDGNFKLSVIKYMHDNSLSLTETGNHFKLGHDIVGKWERIYYEKGPDALFIDGRGRPRKDMNKNSQKNKLGKDIEEDLIAENQKLKMEVAYLKKLQALVQERIKRESKKK